MQVQMHKYSNIIVAYKGIRVSTGGTTGQLMMVWPDFTDSLSSVALFHDKYYGQGNVGWRCFPKFWAAALLPVLWPHESSWVSRAGPS